MGVERNIGKVSHERGQNAEDRVKRILDNAFNNTEMEIPEWFMGHEGATDKEDSRKIDRWIYTDVGKIKLQIKSSIKSARRFSEEYPDIPVISVQAGDSDDEVLGKIISAVGIQRRVYLRLREGE